MQIGHKNRPALPYYKNGIPLYTVYINLDPMVKKHNVWNLVLIVTLPIGIVFVLQLVLPDAENLPYLYSIFHKENQPRPTAWMIDFFDCPWYKYFIQYKWNFTGNIVVSVPLVDSE